MHIHDTVEPILSLYNPKFRVMRQTRLLLQIFRLVDTAIMAWGCVPLNQFDKRKAKEKAKAKAKADMIKKPEVGLCLMYVHTGAESVPFFLTLLQTLSQYLSLFFEFVFMSAFVLASKLAGT